MFVRKIETKTRAKQQTEQNNKLSKTSCTEPPSWGVVRKSCAHDHHRLLCLSRSSRPSPKYLTQCLSSSKGITLLIIGKGRLLKKGMDVWKGRGWAKPTQQFIVLIANAYSFVLQLWLFFSHLPSIFLFFHFWFHPAHPPTRLAPNWSNGISRPPSSSS